MSWITVLIVIISVIIVIAIIVIVTFVIVPSCKFCWNFQRNRRIVDDLRIINGETVEGEEASLEKTVKLLRISAKEFYDKKKEILESPSINPGLENLKDNAFVRTNFHDADDKVSMKKLKDYLSDFTDDDFAADLRAEVLRVRLLANAIIRINAMVEDKKDLDDILREDYGDLLKDFRAEIDAAKKKFPAQLRGKITKPLF